MQRERQTNVNQRQVHRLAQNLFRIAILLLIFCFYALVAALIAVRFAGVIAFQAWTWEVPIFCSWHCIIGCWISTCESQIGSYWMKYHFWILYHFCFFLWASWLKPYILFWLTKRRQKSKNPVKYDIHVHFYKCIIGISNWVKHFIIFYVPYYIFSKSVFCESVLSAVVLPWPSSISVPLEVQ